MCAVQLLFPASKKKTQPNSLKDNFSSCFCETVLEFKNCPFQNLLPVAQERQMLIVHQLIQSIWKWPGKEVDIEVWCKLVACINGAACTERERQNLTSHSQNMLESNSWWCVPIAKSKKYRNSLVIILSLLRNQKQN